MSAVLTVSQINTYIKSLIDYDDNLKYIYVSGELSNFTNHYRTGHFYFTLKDEKSSIKAVMFKSAAERVRFQPENGMKVIISCSVSVFERDGIYQLYCNDMQPDGVGALNLAFEQLKNKLAKEGLFSDEHKKPIPQIPSRIGVITSPTGAAVHDILSILERRFPLAEVVFEPVAVQGDNAVKQICNALNKFNRLKGSDVIILGRGGGSIEDLWAFNEEEVARAIFASEIPVISAVGHETDFTISDFVADLRAATPSAAAELCVPDCNDVLYTVDGYADRLSEALLSLISAYKLQVGSFEKSLASFSPLSMLESLEGKTKLYENSLNAAFNKCINRYESEISSSALKLDALSPLRIISKGYCIASDKNDLPYTSASQLIEGEELSLIFADGKAKCRIEEVNLGI